MSEQVFPSRWKRHKQWNAVGIQEKTWLVLVSEEDTRFVLCGGSNTYVYLHALCVHPKREIFDVFSVTRIVFKIAFCSWIFLSFSIKVFSSKIRIQGSKKRKLELARVPCECSCPPAWHQFLHSGLSLLVTYGYFYSSIYIVPWNTGSIDCITVFRLCAYGRLLNAAKTSWTWKAEEPRPRAESRTEANNSVRLIVPGLWAQELRAASIKLVWQVWKNMFVLILALLLFCMIFKNSWIPLLLISINYLNDMLVSGRTSVKICVGKVLWRCEGQYTVIMIIWYVILFIWLVSQSLLF